MVGDGARRRPALKDGEAGRAEKVLKLLPFLLSASFCCGAPAAGFLSSNACSLRSGQKARGTRPVSERSYAPPEGVGIGEPALPSIESKKKLKA